MTNIIIFFEVTNHRTYRKKVVEMAMQQNRPDIFIVSSKYNKINFLKHNSPAVSYLEF